MYMLYIQYTYVQYGLHVLYVGKMLLYRYVRKKLVNLKEASCD